MSCYQRMEEHLCTTQDTQSSLSYSNTLITYFICKDILMHKKRVTLHKSFVSGVNLKYGNKSMEVYFYKIV